MNENIVKRAFIFSLILGACIGLISLIPVVIGFCTFILMFLSAPIIIIFMKKNEKYISFLTNEQSAILGGIIGFGSTVGFFTSFSPLVCVIKMIFKTYYAYMLPELLSGALWLFVLLVFMTALIFAATNAASAMGMNWVYSHFEHSPEDEGRLDITIED